MKHDWEYKKLSEACDVLYGCPFDSAQFTDDSKYMPLIRIRDIKNSSTETFYKGTYSQEYVIKKGDFLIGMDGEFNVCEWKGVDALLNQRVCKVYSKNPETLDRRFLYWSLPLQLKQIEDLTPFVTVKHLSAKKIADIKIPNIPLDKQINIANELDSLSKIIADCKETLKDYDALEQSIFYDMFGDPVKNEKGWEVKKIEDVYSLKAGKTIKANELSEEPSEGLYPCFGGNGIRGYIAKKSHCGSYPIIGRQGALCGNVNFAEGEFYATEHAVVVSNKIECNPLFSYFLLTNMKLERLAKGVAQPGLSVASVNEENSILPPLPLQQQFASKIEAIEKMKTETKKAIQEGETLFNARMDYWFN